MWMCWAWLPSKLWSSRFCVLCVWHVAWAEYLGYRLDMRSFATEPVNVSRLSSFRAESFPYSGPYPWLDGPDALDRIAAKLQTGEITEEQARQCQFWNANGYIIIKGLVEHQTLDSVWSAYQGAVDSG